MNHSKKPIFDDLNLQAAISLLDRSNNDFSANDVIVFHERSLFVVPVNVERIKVLAIGACGGSGNAFGVSLRNAGEGGTAISNVKVSAGETIEVFVGTKGQDGTYPEGGSGGDSITGYEGGRAAEGLAGGGGGGGGASGAIRVRGEEIIVIAGGGGGGSGAGNGGIIGRGGAGGSFGTNGHGLSPGKVKQGGGSHGGHSPNSSKLGSGGGGGGLYGGGAGSTANLETSGGGAGGSGTVVGNLSVNGGGLSQGVVLITLIRSSNEKL